MDASIGNTMVNLLRVFISPYWQFFITNLLHMGIMLVDEIAHVEQIRLVQDNLNTHTPGSFFEVLDPEAAFELGQQFELHYTPKKGSWLNMAEIEFSALSNQRSDCTSDRPGGAASCRTYGTAGWSASQDAPPLLETLAQHLLVHESIDHATLALLLGDLQLLNPPEGATHSMDREACHGQ